MKGAQLEKEGNPLEAMECYRKAFRLQPDLENEDITGELVATNKPANVVYILHLFNHSGEQK